MRTIKQLLGVMLEHQELFRTGLCTWSSNLYIKRYISREEGSLLYNYIKENRPSAFSSWDAFTHRQNKDWYWKSINITPRIKWIKKHIKRNL